jgi:hypothetical protein
LEKEIKMFTNRFFSLPMIVVLVVVFALIIQDTVATRAIAIDTQAHETQRLRSLEADVARWTAMGEYYQNLKVEEAALQRGRAADAVRWTAVAGSYQDLHETQQLQRSRAADVARWTALAQYYRNQEEQKLPRGRAAYALRWTAMAQYYDQMHGLPK